MRLFRSQSRFGRLRHQGTELVLQSHSITLAATDGGSVVQFVIGFSKTGGPLFGPTVLALEDNGNGDWLTAQVVNNTIVVTIDRSAQAEGTITGTVYVSDANCYNSPQTIAVSAGVLGQTTDPVLNLSNDDFVYEGISAGGAPIVSTITVTNVGGGTLATPQLGTPSASWLTASYNAGIITHTSDPAGQPLGVQTATFTVTCPGASASPQTVTVHMGITQTDNPPVLSVPSTMTFNATEGGANPSSQSLQIGNSGGLVLAGPTISEPSAISWLAETTPSGSNNNYDSTLSVTLGSLTAAGSPYTGTVRVSDANCAATADCVVTLNVAAAGSNTPPAFTLPSWKTFNSSTDDVDGTVFTEPAGGYFA